MLTQLLLFGAFVAVMILLSVNYSKRTRISFIMDVVYQSPLSEMGFFAMLKWRLREEHLFEKIELFQPNTTYQNMFDVVYHFDEDIAKNKPKYAVLMLGINDVLQENNVNEFAIQFENVCNKLTHLQVKMCVCNLPFRTNNESVQKIIDEYNQYFNNYNNGSDFIFINLKKSVIINIHNNEINFSVTDNTNISETIWRTIRTLS